MRKSKRMRVRLPLAGRDSVRESGIDTRRSSAKAPRGPDGSGGLAAGKDRQPRFSHLREALRDSALFMRSQLQPGEYNSLADRIDRLLDQAGSELSAEDVRAMLRKVIERAGSQKATAMEAGVSYSFLNDVLHGRREPSGPLLDALGLERVVLYRAKTPLAGRGEIE